MCTKYWLTACLSLPRKSVVGCTDRPTMTIAVDLGGKATKKTNKQNRLVLQPLLGFKFKILNDIATNSK